MKLSLYLAWRYIINNKRRTFFLITTISIVLMMTIAITVIMDNGLNRQKIDAQINDGKWHLAFMLENENAISRVRNNGNTKKASIVQRTIPFIIGEDSFQMFLIEEEHMDLMFYNLSEGQEPRGNAEILVPEWYLRKQGIVKLPITISEKGIDFKVTGAYRSQADSILNENIKVFMGLEGNQIFTDELFTNSPYDNIINKDKTNKFIFIELNKNADLEVATSQYLKIKGVEAFDMGLDGYDKKPLYNYSLLAAEKRAGFEEDISYNKSSFIIDNFPLLFYLV